ncbi:recombinase family protein [Desulfosporosinus sp. BG]|uniref:recombinase family protein n=1 Tax=Desulfosporosinus sp. BG TaxID=1633135 RepID=UPI00083AEB57|nr:recombinase family protein [Desulfosporosinus sp. BG]ODA42941.1 Site-specific recombinase [Desulfosporosinus sp. BG]
MLVNTTRFLGYDKNEDGELIINEEQAELVRRVFREYLEGKSYAAIAKGLMKNKRKTVTGGERWWDSTISGMLENEKYYGDVLLQKTITVDFLNHKRKENKGQAQKYIVNDNHQPIIPKEIFDKVQDEKERRALLKGNLVGDRHKYCSKYPFKRYNSTIRTISFTGIFLCCDIITPRLNSFLFHCPIWGSIPKFSHRRILYLN